MATILGCLLTFFLQNILSPYKKNTRKSIIVPKDIRGTERIKHGKTLAPSSWKDNVRIY
jgi:hypothetical protein